MSLLPFGWISWIVHTGANFQPTFYVVWAALACVSVLAGGVVFDQTETEGDKAPNGVWTAVIGAMCSFFWPWLAIAAPFVLLATGLFLGGVYFSQQLKKALPSKGLP